MYSILAGRVNGNLGNADESGEEGVVCENDIVQVDLSCLIAFDEISISVIE